MRNEPTATHRAGSVAYVLKGFPVLSETFISSEVYRVEQAGIPLHIFVVKPRDEREHHPVIDRIRARPDYLPPTTRISKGSRMRWLLANTPQFVPSLVRTLRRRPRGVLAAARLALGESVLARSSFWSWPKVSYVRDLLLALALADRLFRTPRIRHLHAHFAHDATTVTWLASMITGLPFSFTAHAKDIYADRLNPRDLLRRKLHAAAFVVTCTEANRRHLERLSDGTSIHRVYHGLNDDFRRFARLCPTNPREQPELRLLAVGRLVRKKGLDIFVEACGLLHRQGLRFEAAIVGEDDDVGDNFRVGEDLRLRIARLGLGDRVRMLGQLGQRELYDHYQDASVFCLPCRVLDDGDRDGIPNVLLEAMWCGIPVVTTGVSGIPELVEHGTNGLLIPEEDPGALARAIGMLDTDRDLAGRLGHAGRATVGERFDGDILACRLAALFERMIT
ncbi:MAG TPA: glycosyltransferase family 4 protein [Pseudonocardiaceae bacterium]|nr:glycosyltransferase family 4 protein [Pseudonocardiaceae bacterium]